MAECKLAIHLDTSHVNRELELFLSDLAQGGSQLSDVFTNRLNAFFNAGGVYLNTLSASGACDVFLKLEFTDAFLDFMAAARAGDFNVV